MNKPVKIGEKIEVDLKEIQSAKVGEQVFVKRYFSGHSDVKCIFTALYYCRLPAKAGQGKHQVKILGMVEPEIITVGKIYK